MNLEEYTQYRETTLHRRPGFAYDTYLCTIPLDFPKVDLHWHDQMELIYVKKGAGTVTVGSRQYPVYAGTIVPVMPGVLHAIAPAVSGQSAVSPAGSSAGLKESAAPHDNTPDISGGQHAGTHTIRAMEYENIIFSLSILDTGDESDWCHSHVLMPLQSGTFGCPCPIYPGTALHDAASAALDDADRACTTMQSGYSLLVKSSLLRFLSALYAHRTAPAANTSISHETFIKEVILYVRDHFAEPITVTDAAAVTSYSAAHFMRLFRQETGRTFVSYLTDYRLGYACYLLRESAAPVSEVAARCGFDNFSYFIRQFRKRYGMTPRQFRR